MFPAHRFATATAKALSLIAGVALISLVSAADSRAQTLRGSCDDAAELAVLPTPLAPWKGAPLRVLFAAEKPLQGELTLVGPDGKVAATATQRYGGPPYFWIAEVATRIEALRERLRLAGPALRRSIWMSVGVQVLSAGTLWVCAVAVGVELSYWTMLGAAAPIFIMAAVPLGVAGFGTRELAAVVVLGFLGVSADQATAASLLYGLTAVVQGVLFAPLFLAKA